MSWVKKACTYVADKCLQRTGIMAINFVFSLPPFPQTEQSMEVSHHQRFNEEAQQRMEELLIRNRALEEETLAQKHVIHLEKLKAEKEFEDLKEQKTRLMSDLEQERNKLVSDITQLNKNKVSNTKSSV